jgi:hypothetical protein
MFRHGCWEVQCRDLARANDRQGREKNPRLPDMPRAHVARLHGQGAAELFCIYVAVEGGQMHEDAERFVEPQRATERLGTKKAGDERGIRDVTDKPSCIKTVQPGVRRAWRRTR